MGGIIGGISSGLMGMSAASTAANAQIQAAEMADQTQLTMYNQTRADEAPWRNTGGAAVTKLAGMVNAGPGNYKQNPGYLAQLAQGTATSNNAAASQGLLLSGAQQQNLTTYGQNAAAGDYQNFLNQYYQSLTPYQSLAGLGQTAVGQTNQTGMNAANQIGSNQLYAGNARASGYYMQNQAAQGILGSVANGGMSNSGGLMGLFNGSSGGSNFSVPTDSSGGSAMGNGLWD